MLLKFFNNPKCQTEIKHIHDYSITLYIIIMDYFIRIVLYIRLVRISVYI